MLDDRTTLRDAGGRGAFVWSPKANRFGWSAYLGHAPSMDPIPPHAAAARADDLAGLPPAWIGVGDSDLFHDEDVDYARRLEEAGVPCALHVAPGMYHAAERFLPKAPTAQAFRADMMAALRGAVGAGSGGCRFGGRWLLRVRGGRPAGRRPARLEEVGADRFPRAWQTDRWTRAAGRHPRPTRSSVHHHRHQIRRSDHHG